MIIPGARADRRRTDCGLAAAWAGDRLGGHAAGSERFSLLVTRQVHRAVGCEDPFGSMCMQLARRRARGPSASSPWPERHTELTELQAGLASTKNPVLLGLAESLARACLALGARSRCAGRREDRPASV